MPKSDKDLKINQDQSDLTVAFSAKAENLLVGSEYNLDRELKTDRSYGAWAGALQGIGFALLSVAISMGRIAEALERTDRS